MERRLAAIDLYSTAPLHGSYIERAEAARNTLIERLNELKAEALSAEAVARKTRMLFPEIRDFDQSSLKRELEDSSSNELPATLRKAIEESSFNEERREEIIKFFSQWQVRLKKIEQLFRMINEARDKETENKVNEAFRDFSRELFLSKIHVVEDSNATGDDIILQIAKSAPPGFFVRIMGMQNIKGTGLDFVYRWLALERVLEAAKQLTDQSEQRRMEAVDFFTYFDEYGLITRPVAIEALREALKAPINQTVIMKRRLESALRVAESGESEELKKQNKHSSFIEWLLRTVESFLESGDSKRRRREADRVLKELIRKTISHQRASVILRDITVRQKGGWLKKQFMK